MLRLSDKFWVFFHNFFSLSVIFPARQKLTSPKWNRFKGIRLRWKDKIRLNNLIWRCWHMQCKYVGWCECVCLCVCVWHINMWPVSLVHTNTHAHRIYRAIHAECRPSHNSIFVNSYNEKADTGLPVCISIRCRFTQ